MSTIGLFAAPEPAIAKLTPKFDQLMLYNTLSSMPIIRVQGDGVFWTSSSQSSVKVALNYYVSLKKGSIETIRAHLLGWESHGFDPNLADTRHPGGGKWRQGTFNFTIAGTAFATLKTHAIDACNRLPNAQPNKPHTAYIVVPFNLWVRALRVGNVGTKTVLSRPQFRIICEKAPKKIEVGSVDYDIENTNKCPKRIKIELTFHLNREQPVRYTIFQTTAGRTKEIDATAQLQFIGTSDGHYVAKGRHDLLVDSQTTEIRAVVKNGGPEFVIWRNRKPNRVSCPPMRVLSSTLRYDQGGLCPRIVYETAQFFVSAPGWVNYRIRHRGGLIVTQGRAAARLHGDKYVATAQRVIHLREFDALMRAEPQSNVDAASPWTPLQVVCGTKKKAVPNGPSDLTNEAAPSHNDPPHVVPDCGRGFRRVSGSCIPVACKRGYRRVGKRCEKAFINCARGFRNKAGKCVAIPCKRGSKRVAGKCVLIPCRRGFKRKGLRCVKVSIVCQRGFRKVGSRCIPKPCRSGFKRVGERCKKIIVGCRRGFKRVRNRCVRVPPPTSRPCRRDRVRINGRCVKPAA